MKYLLLFIRSLFPVKGGSRVIKKEKIRKSSDEVRLESEITTYLIERNKIKTRKITF